MEQLNENHGEIMNYIENIANLITIRNFLSSSIENLHMKLSREDIKNIQARVQYLDKVIVEHSLKMDLSNIDNERSKAAIREYSITSTEDTEAVYKNAVKSKKDKLSRDESK